MMHFVSRGFVDDLLRCIARMDIDTAPLTDGLDFPTNESHPPSKVVPWDDFATLLERLEDRVAGPIGLERVGEHVGELKPIPILRRLAGLTAQPSLLYRAGQRWALRRALPILVTSIDNLAPDRLRITCAVPLPLRTCPQLFHLGTGALRALPQSLDLPASHVHTKIDSRRVEYEILLPPSGSVRARLRRAHRAFFSSRAALEQLSEQQAELEERVYDLRTLNKALTESEERIRERAEACTDPTIEFASNGKILYLSPSVTSLTGYLPGAMRGTSLTDWMHPEEVLELTSDLERIFKEKRSERLTVRMRHQKGNWVWIELSTSLFDDGSGTRNAVATLRNVSERVQRSLLATRSETETPRTPTDRETDAPATLGSDAAARIAHCINNPLTALIGQLQLQIADGGPAEACLERSLQLSRRIQRVISGTLELYRDGTLHRSTTSVGQLLRDVQSELSNRIDPERVSINVDSSSFVLPICVDRSMITTALVSVVENALEATAHDRGGRVDVNVRTESKEERIAFIISDNGPGIRAELRRRIFDVRFTTKPGGTGLGLAAAQTFVSAHGGTIDTGSGRDSGAVFTIELPLR